MSKKVMTFVFEYGAGNKLIGNIMSAMSEGDPVGNALITGASMGNAIARLDRYEEIYERVNHNLLDSEAQIKQALEHVVFNYDLDDHDDFLIKELLSKIK